MKKLRKSKTINVNTLAALTMVDDRAVAWVVKHPRAVFLGIIGINIILRFMTKDKIQMTNPIKKMLISSLILIAVIGSGAASCGTVPLDRAMSALDGNDPTVTLSGGGIPARVGDLAVRYKNGSPATDQITMWIPDLKCGRDSCAEYQWFRPDGSPGPSGGIKKGDTSKNVPLDQILGASILGDMHDREYAVSIRMFFIGPDGQENTAIGRAFLRIHVLNDKYTVLGCDDPNLAWTTPISKDCTLQMTSGYRAALCGIGCK